MTTDQLEQKRQRWDRAMKVLVFILVGCIVGPFAAFAVGGLLAIFMVWLFQTVFFAFAPVFTAWIANKRIQALKAVAAANPIETLENQYLEKEQALGKYEQHMNEYYAALQEVHRNIEAHYDEFPDQPCAFDEQYAKMVRGLQNRQAKFKRLKKALADFEKFINQKRSEWRVAQSLTKANRLAKVGEDFMSRLMKDTATQTITSTLDTALREMETSMLDEQIEQELAEEKEARQAARQTTVVSTGAPKRRIELPALDLGDPLPRLGVPKEVEGELVEATELTSRRRR